jgi:nucleotide-binding universal stress UspA family protein
MLHRIVVGLDGSPLAESILPYVSTLAKGLHADITLLLVNELPDELDIREHQPVLEQVVQRSEEQAKSYLQKIAQQLGREGLRVQTAVATGDAATEIITCAQRDSAGLIALATHGRSGMQRWLYGSIAERVVRTSRTPVLLVRPTTEPAEEPVLINRVVVPLDGSFLGEASLLAAEDLARMLNVPMVLLRVIQPVYLYGADSGFDEGYDYSKYIEPSSRSRDCNAACGSG